MTSLSPLNPLTFSSARPVQSEIHSLLSTPAFVGHHVHGTCERDSTYIVIDGGIPDYRVSVSRVEVECLCVCIALGSSVHSACVLRLFVCFFFLAHLSVLHGKAVEIKLLLFLLSSSSSSPVL